MNKFLRINMETESLNYEEVKEEYKLFGGRDLVAKLLNDEVDPQCDPLGSGNKFIVCPGLLTDSAAPSTGRLSVGGKSPLTGTIKEANAGGVVAKMLAKLGIKAIIIEGKPANEAWYILKITQEKAELVSGEKYVGLNNYRLTEELQKNYGDKIGVVSIGGAGEKGYLNSTLQVTSSNKTPSRAAARGGLGAVMGSKGIKAIVLDVGGPLNPDYVDKVRFMNAAKNYINALKENPLTGQALPTLGTAVLVNLTNSLGVLPTRNYSSGNFEHVESICGEHMLEIQSQRKGKSGHACISGCSIGCSNVYNNKQGEYLTSSLEYETIALLGSNCGISSLDTIATLDRMCDDFGLDTIETGATIGVCMEAGKIGFGDDQGVIKLVEEMMAGTEFGKILGQGTAYTGKHLGVKRIPTVKGQSLSGYDPRALKGTGVTFATSPMGADHTSGNLLGFPGVDPLNKEGQVEASTMMQVLMATVDSLGMCLFASFATDKPENVGYLLEMMACKFGGKWDQDRLFGIGVQTISLEKKFNKAAGFTEKDNRLPEFMYQEELPPHNVIFDITEEELGMAIPF
ncbi:MAG: hypothetical protein APF81_21505 [Desulfosporosinus sp. BRH_c37]|nr:MAG: hypothetical protein APF81_21505 [Desulfosporosinus sp. BRH_c37]